jgi:hypothetical protein
LLQFIDIQPAALDHIQPVTLPLSTGGVWALTTETAPKQQKTQQTKTAAAVEIRS